MSRISIQRYESEGQVRFSVLLDRRTALADFYNERWATTFAEVAEALIPVALGHDTTLRYIYDGLLSLAHTRFLVAGVLERAFKQIWHARKVFELRKNDRDFKAGDVLHLREYSLVPEGQSAYSGKSILALVVYVLDSTEGWGLQKGFVVMSIKLLARLDGGQPVGM